MAPKDTITFEGQRGPTEIGSAPDAVHVATAVLIGSQARSLSLGRFLLSSTGFHLILVWIAVSIGLPQTPSTPQPLVVTIIRSPSSESAAPSGPLVRAPARRPAAPAGQEHVAQPSPAPSVMPEGNREEVAEGGARPLPTVEAMEPKAVGMSGGGSGAGGIGASGAPAVSSPSSGPVLLGSDGDSEGAARLAGRSGGRGLDASLVAPLTPSVTIGSLHGGGGRGGSGTAGGGGYAAPNYGINPLPKYPPLAREKGYEGTVYLRVLVRVDGRVGQLAVDRSSGYEILDRTAVDSVQGWAFFPAKKGGKPVESWVLLPVKFALN